MDSRDKTNIAWGLESVPPGDFNKSDICVFFGLTIWRPCKDATLINHNTRHIVSDPL
ncbi:MAG: hypothetical protein IPP79_23420 [Chitinophagaceae bacterium]|nr:hypothetical protein [Chitinophagaceae bacterium]